MAPTPGYVRGPLVGDLHDGRCAGVDAQLCRHGCEFDGDVGGGGEDEAVGFKVKEVGMN